MTIRAVIFDLDSCLSAADEVGAQLFAPAFQAIREANRGMLSDAALGKAFDECWRFPFDDIARRYGFSKAMRDAGFQEFVRIEVRCPMHGYPDLGRLIEVPGKRFLVTSGFRRLQESKIRALEIAPLFEKIDIDAIDEPNPKGKESLFREILRTYRFNPKHVLVVGDNPDSEIAAGNRLGMVTAQIIRPGVSAGTNAMHTIDGLAEVIALSHRLPE